MKKSLVAKLMVLAVFVLLEFLSITVFNNNKIYGQKENIKLFSTILGTWTATNDSTSDFVEVWEKADRLSLRGYGYIINHKGDTLFKEELKLEQSRGGIFYSVFFKSTTSKAIKFKLVKPTNSIYTFVNKQNDFPTTITYSFLNSKSLEVRLNGKNKNKMLLFKKKN